VGRSHRHRHVAGPEVDNASKDDGKYDRTHECTEEEAAEGAGVADQFYDEQEDARSEHGVKRGVLCASNIVRLLPGFC
jgi:hypothetical protein